MNGTITRIQGQVRCDLRAVEVGREEVKERTNERMMDGENRRRRGMPISKNRRRG